MRLASKAVFVLILASLLIYVIHQFSPIKRFKSPAHTAVTNTNGTNKENNSSDCAEVGARVRQLLGEESMSNVHLTKPAVRGGQPTRILIVATMRTGSTFLAETLASHPGTFYLFEPLSTYGLSQIRHGFRAAGAIQDLTDLLHCRFNALSDKCHQLTQQKSFRSCIWPEHSPSLEKVWQELKDSCFTDEDFLSSACPEFPIQILKTVRLRLQIAQKLLQDERLNIKLLHVVRDPRAVMVSRIKMGWCQRNGGAANCTQTAELCQDLVTEFYLAQVLSKLYPKRFVTVRYEGLTGNVYSSVQHILGFLGLDFHENVQAFLDKHTKLKSGLVGWHKTTFFSTIRDTKSMATRWMKDLEGNFSVVESIQNTCAEAMRLWGYENLNSLASFDY